MCLAGLLVVGAAWLLRSFGVHFDENNYLSFSRDRPHGDVDTVAKSVVFYLLNFGIDAAFSRQLGTWRAAGLYVVYAAANLAALAWLALSITGTRARQIAFFAVVVLSPLFLFNSVQVMMETPLLGLVALVFASLVRQQHADRASLRWTAFAAALLAASIKTTAIPPLVILAMAFGWGRWRRAVAPLAGVAAALLLLVAQEAVFHTPSGNYGSFPEDLNLPRVVARLGETGAYLWMWVFFLSPALLLAAAWGLRPGVELGARGRLWLIAGLTLAATFAVQVHSLLSFARYAYPSVWLGLLSVAWLAVEAVTPRWTAALALAVAIPSADMLRGSDARFSLWPRLVVDEGYASGYTVLPGPRLFLWWAASGRTRTAPCFYVPGGTSAGEIRQIMGYLTRAPRFFEAGDEAAFAACRSARGVIERRISPSAAEPCRMSCESGPWATTACAVQPLRYPERTGSVILNATCLP